MNVCFNGDLYPADASLFTAQNRSFKWGDGLFETMKVFRGEVLLKKLHFERLFHSLQVVQIDSAHSFSENFTGVG
jgi:branched-chain amino acid aminotransferase